jgi:hypothetical protein
MDHTHSLLHTGPRTDRPRHGTCRARLALMPLLAAVSLSPLFGADDKVAAAPAKTTADQSGRYNPYADNNGDQLPPKYTGPRYRLNHHYPATPQPSPANPPWQQALQGKPISKTNAIAYVMALKNYIAKDMSVLVDDYTKWDPFKTHWYDQPWIATKVPGANPTTLSWPGREPIQGAYPGPGFDSSTYPDLKNPMQDYVAVYYNQVAAYTLNQIWQQPNPYQPQAKNGQFQEGAIIIKLAMTTASGNDWPPMKGSTKSQVFVPPFDPAKPQVPVLTDVYVLQFDLIVKDTKTAPKTGWVFATLVYDKDAPGATTWDKMVPLGAMWGNDPGVNSAQNPKAPLEETVVNPAAPAYAKVTLGWGGRLSGPNDAAAGPFTGPNASPVPRYSSCMSCHGAAENPAGFLVPLQASPLPPPGSPAWMNWFQDRAGNVPQDSGRIALDYEMVTTQAFTNQQALTGDAEAIKHFQARMLGLRRRGNPNAAK